MIPTSIRRPARLSALALSLAVAASRASAQGSSAPAAAPASAPTTAAPADSARTALARQLLDAMNAGAAMLQGIELGIPMQKAANPRIPDVFWTEFQARARREMPKFIDRAVPIYANRFSKQELEQLLAFYRSPAGRRLAAEAPTISADMMRAGQMWGVELGADTAKDLAAKGVILQ